jgi:hypothetical protein
MCQAVSGVMCKTFILCALILAGDKAVPGNKHTHTHTALWLSQGGADVCTSRASCLVLSCVWN